MVELIAAMNSPQLDIVILDQTESCPYLDGKIARMPLRKPIASIGPEEIDFRLSEGHRRTGEYVYQTQCPNCRACEPLRIDTERYRFSRNGKRVFKRNEKIFEQRIGPLTGGQDRIDLFNKHRLMRGLAKVGSDIDLDEYEWHFVRSCFDSFEITYWDRDELVCVAICDRGKTSLSAVYTYYDPDYSSRGIGTYSILKQIEYCQRESIKHLYLGYYVADSPHMKYKARFLPQQRLIEGEWVDFEKSSS